MSLRTVRAGDVLQLRRRAVAVEPAETYTEIGVRSFGRGLFKKEPLTGADLGTKRVFHIEPGDFVVSNVFGWEGAVAVAAAEHEDTIGSHRFMTWTPTDEVDVRYVQHYLLSEAGLVSLRRASPGSAGRNRTLSIANFEAIQIPLPDLPEQRRIAAHLDRIAESTKDRRAGAAAFEVAWRALIDQLTFGAGEPGIAIGELLSPKQGTPVFPEARYRIAGVYSFGRGMLTRPDLQGNETKYKAFTQLDATDLVYSKLGAFEGAVAVVPPEFEGFHVSPEFPVFRLDGECDPRYVRYAVIAESFVAQLAGATSGVGARQKRVSPGNFAKLSIPYPSLARQGQIADQLDLMTRAFELKKQASTLRAALLPSARNLVFRSLS